MTINKQKHVCFTLGEFEGVLNYDGDGFLNDAVATVKVVAIAQQIDTDLMKTVLQFAGWVGTPGNPINTVARFNLMPQRREEMAMHLDKVTPSGRPLAARLIFRRRSGYQRSDGF